MHAGFEVDIEDERDALPPMDAGFAARRRQAQVFRPGERRRSAGLVAELPNQNVRRRITLAKVRFKILRLYGARGVQDEGSRIGDAELRSVRRNASVEQAVASDHLG